LQCGSEDRAIVDVGLKALAFDSGPPLVWDEPAATYDRASDEHGRLTVSPATNRLGLGDKIARFAATATRPWASMTGMSASATTTSSSCGRSPTAARFIDCCALPEAGRPVPTCRSGSRLDLVGGGEDRWRHGDAERLGGLEIGDQLESVGWRLWPRPGVRYDRSVIRSFGDKRTAALFEDQVVRDFQGIARRAKRKLEAINAASRISDLAVPPSNHLEKLRGDLEGFYAVRINDQWRVVFRWTDGDATEVRIVDYHWQQHRRHSETRMSEDEFAPVTPGEMLKDEFLAEYRLSQSGLAKAVGISPNRIAEIVNNRRRITADTALRLGLYFGTSAEFWMNLQSRYDLKMARRQLTPEEADRIKAQRAA
jgi:addiction module HigA family antidote